MLDSNQIMGGVIMKRHSWPPWFLILAMTWTLLLPTATPSEEGPCGLVVSIDVWQTPNKLGVLLEGDGGILWAHFTGSPEDYRGGTLVQQVDHHTAAPHKTRPVSSQWTVAPPCASPPIPHWWSPRALPSPSTPP